jgi:hypothetical protein
VGEDSDRSHQDDLDVETERADAVKGGVFPPEPSSPSRGLAAHKSKRVPKAPAGPSRGMAHE